MISAPWAGLDVGVAEAGHTDIDQSPVAPKVSAVLILRAVIRTVVLVDPVRADDPEIGSGNEGTAQS